MPRLTVELSDLEARSVLETLNRAFDLIPSRRTKDAVDRAASRIEEELRALARREREAA